MDILHTDTWPTSGLTKKCIWSGSTIWWGMLGKFHSSQCMSKGSLITKICIWPKAEREIYLPYRTDKATMVSP